MAGTTKRQQTSTAFESRDIKQVNVHAAYSIVRDLPSTDRPLKVHDAVEGMYTGKRNGLSERQFLAAQVYGEAYQAQFSGLGGAMDFERVRGPRSYNISPPLSALVAAERIAKAHVILRKKFDRDPTNKTADTIIDVVKNVAGLGQRVEDYARDTFGVGEGGRVSGRNHEKISALLKAGLDALSDRWHGAEIDASEIVSYLAPDAKPTTINPGAFAPGRTVHADRHKVQEAVEARSRKPRKKARPVTPQQATG